MWISTSSNENVICATQMSDTYDILTARVDVNLEPHLVSADHVIAVGIAGLV